MLDDDIKFNSLKESSLLVDRVLLSGGIFSDDGQTYQYSKILTDTRIMRLTAVMERGGRNIKYLRLTYCAVSSP